MNGFFICQRSLRLMLIPFIMLFAAQTIFGRSTEEPGGTVKGNVATTDNMPAAGVTVTIKNLNRNAITDEQGDFIFHHIKGGSYEIEISVIGYQTIRRTLVVENDR